MYLEFSVWEQRLVLSERPFVVGESQNYVYARFIFSADWEGLGKTAYFGSEETAVVVDEKGLCLVPHEALIAPSCEVYVVGSDAGNAKRITTNVAEFAVRATGDGAGELPAEPTPTVYEQILSAYVDLDGEAVKSVNGFEPDEDGNVHLETGTDDHAQLRNRDSANQHPMSAISGLEDTISGLETAIDGKQPAGNYQPAGDYLTAESDPTVPGWAKQPQKPSYTASEVGADAAGTAQSLFDSIEIPEAPEKLPNPYPITINGTSYDGSQAVNLTIEGGSGDGTSDHNELTNRDAADQHPMSAITGLDAALAGKQPAGDYIETETDPTVPAWAKAASKPTYTAAEVGALPASYTAPVQSVNGKTGVVSLSASDVGALPDTTVIPTVPTTLPNPQALTFTGAATGAYDGSSSLTINIPEGGSGGGGDEWTLLHDSTAETDVGTVVINVEPGYNEYYCLFTGHGWVVANGADATDNLIGQLRFVAGDASGEIDVTMQSYGGKTDWPVGAWLYKFGSGYRLIFFQINQNAANTGGVTTNNSVRKESVPTITSVRWRPYNNPSQLHFAAGAHFQVWGR